jgi:hypothetical protein
MIDKKATLEKLIATKEETLAFGEWELQFTKEYFKEYLQPGAIEGARMALADARKAEKDADDIAKLNDTVEEIKDSQMKVARLERTLKDLAAQVEYLKKIVIE